ncbi:MAG TPA: diguanylate cyclase, partial [Arenimonas sp.]|nr:diguanylate cyclase [Arenimonas sp.]
NAELEAMVRTRTHELEAANSRLDSMAHRDGLTEIANRRRLDRFLAEAWQQCRARKRPISLLLIDVDHFKDFNDQHGHLAGDELLKRLAHALADCLRRGEDLVARYGGEEFMVVLPGADAGIAASLAESMRAAVEAAALGSTISVGHATAIPDGDAVEYLIERADHALYAAKQGGRNRVVAA